MPTSLILRTTARGLLPIMLFLSVIVLFRGHNEPGGGFVGGLLAAAGFSLYALAQGLAEAKRLMPIRPSVFIATGLGCAALSGVPGLLSGDGFLHGIWGSIPVAGFTKDIAIGTPVIFDIGVYFAVMGVVLLMIFSLEEEYNDDRAARA
ncbi:MAG: Na(+)/H(+) antiporter subunit B [Phycisphaerae bacterium]|nr:Na(+)/H(+) antiporter subunit B [Phycisphaerae bacterium]